MAEIHQLLYARWIAEQCARNVASIYSVVGQWQNLPDPAGGIPIIARYCRARLAAIRTLILAWDAQIPQPVRLLFSDPETGFQRAINLARNTRNTIHGAATAATTDENDHLARAHGRMVDRLPQIMVALAQLYHELDGDTFAGYLAAIDQEFRQALDTEAQARLNALHAAAGVDVATPNAIDAAVRQVEQAIVVRMVHHGEADEGLLYLDQIWEELNEAQRA